ncbi:GNAT family N-acetyltransferase [Synechocystis salina LEGE 06099]|uniref:GNAT family N-acetyltransferase n=1 Tax=Synechocystis salina TaxID=945780 RepID=UPI00188115BE|nr:GNAT family N-acetyltransferase [Synechocystis salina]MBE9204545.1 GNAT family N-acetyltransferase [Synechocystis salina LEGE 06099]
MTLIIRPATTDDATSLAELAATTFQDTYGKAAASADLEAYLAQTFNPEKEQEILADDRQWLLVAESKGVLVGYVHLFDHPAPTMETELVTPTVELVRLYLLTTWQHQGLGNQLMQACLDLAQAQAFASVWLKVWDHNTSAIAFYQRWQFQKKGEVPYPVGNAVGTTWIMERSI